MLPNKVPSVLIGAADGLIGTRKLLMGLYTVLVIGSSVGKNKTSASDNFQQFIYQPNPDSLWYF